MSHSETRRVRSPDGVETLMRSKGPRNGPGVILIHGVLHCSLAWKYQFADPALAGVRLVSYDIRGHGEADKPSAAEYYQPERFADELQAVIEASGLDRPILLGWSLGGRMIFNHLEKYGWDHVGGVLLTGARAQDSKFVKLGQNAMLLGCSDDLETRIHARREFVRACHEVAPSPNDLIDLVTCAMLMPPDVLRHFIGRPLEYADLLSRISAPVRVVHGALDTVCPLAAVASIPEVNPQAQMTVYEGIGHAPFFEQPPRFNLDLLDFVRTCSDRTA